MPKTNAELESDICDLLQSVTEYFTEEDRSTRERQLRHMRRLKLYWNNFSQIYWSEKANDYKIFSRDINSQDTDQDYYDKPVNVFKAFLETIIAALSIQIPAVSCVPDDADSPLDISTAKAGDKISELIYKHNDVIFVWLHALYIYCTEIIIAAHHYPKADESYGTYDKPKMGEEEVEGYVCPTCGTKQPDELFSEEELAKFNPDDEDAELNAEIQEHGPVCIECGIQLDKNLQKSKLMIPKLIGVTKEPKTRICIETYGGLYVKVANYAKDQAGTPYLIFCQEIHFSTALEMYPTLWEKIPQGGWNTSGPDDPYEQYGRLNTQYRGEYPEGNVTIKKAWLRPCAFNILPEEDSKRLHKKFPNGAKVVMINNVCVDFENESLDDNWTLTQNPMADYLTHEPLGELLTNIQDIVNDLISLTLQTIEHGMGQTFADPAVVNFNAQRQIEAQPGTLSPTKPVPGAKNISDSFHTLQTASLSPEVFSFYKIIQELGQFVSGALPSIFGGGQGAGSSRTASEYAMSKGMAMQRLQTPYRMLTIWWKKIFGKVIPMYMKNMVEDERMVEKNDMGKFVNVFLRKAEMDGKIGSIELESDDKLPITDEQQADIIMQLMNLNNEEVTSALMDPENLPYISKIIKIPSFRLPGQEDRQKQYEEIDELINAAPIPIDPQSQALYEQAKATGHPDAVQPQEQPSVEVDPDVDNHQVEAAICKSWLIGPAGRLAKVENPNGYKNVLLHMKAHLTIVAQQMQVQQLHDDQLAIATGKSGQKTSEAPGKSTPAKPEKTEKVSGEKIG